MAKGVTTSKQMKQCLTISSDLQEQLRVLLQNNESRKKTIHKESNQIIASIESFRQNINTILDELEQTTLHINKCWLKNRDNDTQAEVEKCQYMYDQLKALTEDIRTSIQCNNESCAFRSLKSCQMKTKDAETLLQNTLDDDISLTFTPNPDIEKFLTPLFTIGEITSNTYVTSNPSPVQTIPAVPEVSGNHVYTVENVKKYSVHSKKDKTKCFVTGVCMLVYGTFVLTDSKNNTMKLLSEKFTVLDRCEVHSQPLDLCHITDNEVAISCCNYVTSNAIQFMKAKNRKLICTRTVNLDHNCRGITYHGGNLYVGSVDGLFVYTVAGSFVKKLYNGDVVGVTCSSQGDKIYVTSGYDTNVTTLDYTGRILSTLETDDLNNPTGLTYLDNENIVVCGCESHTIVQVDKDGKRKLSTLATSSDGVFAPWSLYFNTKTRALIVGQTSDTILVMKLK